MFPEATSTVVPDKNNPVQYGDTAMIDYPFFLTAGAHVEDEVVYKDNVQYQKLFGGNAMLSVIRMDPGHRVDELFDAHGRAAMAAMAEELTVAGGPAQNVITPLTALQFSHNLVTSPDGLGAIPVVKYVAPLFMRLALQSAAKGAWGPLYAATAAIEARFDGLPVVRLGRVADHKRVKIIGIAGSPVIDSPWTELKQVWQQPLSWD